MPSYVGAFYIAKGEGYCNGSSCLCGLSHSRVTGNITFKIRKYECKTILTAKGSWRKRGG